MDIQTTKIELVKEILDIENLELIEKVVNLLKKETQQADLEVLNEETTDYETFMTSLRNTKLDFIKDFINLENKEAISKLESILWKKNDFWDELSLSEKDEIKLGIKQLDEGKRFSYESVLKEIS